MFGSSLRGGSRDGGVVTLSADTQVFNQKIEAAERQWKDSVGQMSREALKLDLAQDRLKRSLAQYGAESNAAKRATIGLKDAEEQATRSAMKMDAAHRQAGNSLGGIAPKGQRAAAMMGLLKTNAAVAAGSLIGSVGFTYAVRQSIEAASALDEQMSASVITFGASSGAVQKWSTTTASAFGISRAAALQAANGFGGLFTTMGLIPARARDMSTTLVELAGDLASFKDTSPEEALIALRSALVGESEPIRRYNVLLNEARVQQQAFAQTGKTAAASLTDQDKVLARYSLILQQTSLAQGDAARTAGSYANQTRQLRANITNLQANLGKLATPFLADVIGQMNRAAAASVRLSTGISGLGRSAGISVQGLSGLAKLLGGPIFAPLRAKGAIGELREGDFTGALKEALGFSDVDKKPGDVAKGAAAFDSKFGLGALTKRGGRTTSPASKTPSFGQPGFKPGSAPAVPTGDTTLTRLQRLLLAESDPGNDLADGKALLAYYASVVKNGKLTGDKLFQAKQDYNSQLQRVQSIQDQIGQDAKAAAAKRAATIEKQQNEAADKQKAAREKTKTAYRTNLDVREQRLENARLRATLTETLTDDRKRNQALIAFYRAESHDTNLLVTERTAYEKKLIEALKDKKEITGATGSAAADFSKLSFGFLQELQGVTNQFASNVTQGTGTKVGKVELHQHFPHPPTRDLHTEAIYGRNALERWGETVG